VSATPGPGADKPLDAFAASIERRALEVATSRSEPGERVVSADGRERVGIEAVLLVPADRLSAESELPHGPLEDWCIEIFGRLICFGDPPAVES
jgi:hypothetical protein